MRLLVVLHRWLGVALSAVLTLWFLSGIVLIYRSYPAVTTADRLSRARPLDPLRIRLSAEQAFASASARRPRHVVLATFDDRPIYVSESTAVYADDGSEQRDVTRDMVDRAATAWSGRPLAEARIDAVTSTDQWTLSGGLRSLRPLFKYSWPDGQHVYVSGETADVVQYTTRQSRLWAYLGAIPHWLYVPSLRTRDAAWLAFMKWAALVGCVATVMGLVIALWRYSPRRRYRHHGMPTSIPFHGWRRWHTLVGLVAGLSATAWLFSGWLSLEPFGFEDWLTRMTVPVDTPDDRRALVTWQDMDALLLSGALDLSAYQAKPPALVLASLPDFATRELEYASIGAKPIYIATNGRGETRVVAVAGAPTASFDVYQLARQLREAGRGHADVAVLDAFDAYYRDRHGQLPLPVIRVRMHDRHATRYYVSPKTATVVASYSSREWVSRWLYHGLHSMDLPWLYNHRPLWDIVVLTLLAAGAALCGTSLVLAWRAVARALGSAAAAEGILSFRPAKLHQFFRLRRSPH